MVDQAEGGKEGKREKGAGGRRREGGEVTSFGAEPAEPKTSASWGDP